MDTKNIKQIVVIFALLTLAIACNKMHNHEPTFSNEESNQIDMHENNTIKNLSHDIFYENYDSINKLNTSELNEFQIIKVKKDTVLPIPNEKINIEAGSYIQNYSDPLIHIAAKLPDNTTIFIYWYKNFPSNNTNDSDELEDFISLSKQKKKNIQNILTISQEPGARIISYDYKKNGKQYNGHTRIQKKHNLFLSMELESNTLDQEDLKLSAIYFFVSNAFK